MVHRPRSHLDVIAVSSSGKSFRALAAYLATGRTGEERDRVAWSAARNLPTNDPELGATFMRATAAHSTKVEKPVYQVVLSFDPTDVPDRATLEPTFLRRDAPCLTSSDCEVRR